MVDMIAQKPPLPESGDLQRRRKLREDVWMLWLKDPKQDQDLFWQKVELMGLESEREALMLVWEALTREEMVEEGVYYKWDYETYFKKKGFDDWEYR